MDKAQNPSNSEVFKNPHPCIPEFVLSGGRRYATSRKAAGSRPDEVIEYFLFT
jgi:hypothetical protein